MNSTIKILDFGLSNYYNPDETLKTFCGSLYFAAPELLKGQPYMGPEVDVWALGVVLYVMVCGKVPFDDKSLSALHDKIKNCQISYPSHLSPECRNLLEMMIHPDGKKRATLSEVIDHPWLNLGCDLTVRSYANDRVPLASVDPILRRFMEEEFKTQYTPQQINSILETACNDWAKVKNHPLVSLYYLVRDKMIRDGVLMPPPVQKSLSTRSPSCPDLVPPPGLTHKQDISDARKTRNLAVTIPSTGHAATKSTPMMAGERQRSYSVSSAAAPLPSAFNRVLEDSEIRTVYLKGLFSTVSSTKKTPNELRAEIVDVLRKDAISFENRGAIFVCEYQASVSKDEAVMDEVEGTTNITFEVHIVKVAVFGSYGVLFKRIHGDISIYKNLCSQILLQLDL